MELDEHLEGLVANETMSNDKLRAMWARTIIIKSVLMKNGLITREEWDRQEAVLVKDIKDLIKERIRKDLGL